MTVELTDDELLNARFTGFHRFGENKPAGDIKGDIKPYGSFEVFHAIDGWYWQPCFPGYLPDGEPHGPFLTALEAFNNAQEDA